MSWSTALSSRAERFHRKAEQKRTRTQRVSFLERATDLIPAISAPVRALILKDARLFWRDPGPVVQFMIFFGLLCMYIVNFRTRRTRFPESLLGNAHLLPESRFLVPDALDAYHPLRLPAIHPGGSPPLDRRISRRIGLPRVLLQKFWTSFASSGLLTGD